MSLSLHAVAVVFDLQPRCVHLRDAQSLTIHQSSLDVSISINIIITKLRHGHRMHRCSLLLPLWCGLSVCWSQQAPPKTADPIEMLFGVWTWNLVLGGGSDPSRGRGSFLEGEVAARYKLYGHCIVSWPTWHEVCDEDWRPMEPYIGRRSRSPYGNEHYWGAICAMENHCYRDLQ